jgi:Glycosyl hydrolase family 12/Cellulose binding domain
MTWTPVARTTRTRRRAASLAIAVLAAVGLLALSTPGAKAATTQLCQMQYTSVAGGVYNVQNNEWGSGASECVSTDGNADFTVANSAISNATNGAPGGYPSIYQGCHWGICTSGGLSATPVQVSNITTGKVTTSWSTTQPGGGNDYDVAYDIWFNQTPTTTGQPNGTELMIWLNHNGPVQPFGSEVATNVSLGGRSYNVWEGSQGSFDTVSYTMTTGTTSVSGLDLAPLVQDAVSRGYTKTSWYLIDMEAGFELWQGGAGLATNSFSVDINGAAPVPATCSGTGSVASSWSGGFQASIVVADTGAGPLNGWTLNFTLPSGVTLASTWGGTFTQSGQAVTVTNAPYDGVIKQGGSVTIGFTANATGTGTIPASIACS